MSLKHSILGWLERREASGYDLKKAIAASRWQPWSGNNNQIYTALLQLSQEGLVQARTEHRDDGPSKKIYAITPAGRSALRDWVRKPSEAPESRNEFLLRLACAAVLDAAELRALVAEHCETLRVALLVARHEAAAYAQASGAPPAAGLAPSASWLESRIAQNPCALLEAELGWARALLAELGGE